MNSRDLKAMRELIATLRESTAMLKAMTPEPARNVQEWIAQQSQRRDEYEAWLKRGAPQDDSFAVKFHARARFGGMALK